MKTSRQTTLRKRTAIAGVGVHSGLPVTLTLNPADANSGVVFVRAGQNGAPDRELRATARSVTATELATVLGDENGVFVSTVEHVIFRPSFVFGRDGGALPTFIRLARFAPVTPIVGPGTQRLQPIWVEDVAEYYAQARDLPAAGGRTFELGGPDAPTWNEFWDRLKRALGSHRPSLHVPFRVMRLQALLTERLPGAPVTRDQLTMLELGDNVVTTTDAVDTFGLELVPLAEQLRPAAG